jgi:hypothetical protein
MTRDRLGRPRPDCRGRRSSRPRRAFGTGRDRDHGAWTDIRPGPPSLSIKGQKSKGRSSATRRARRRATASGPHPRRHLASIRTCYPPYYLANTLILLAPVSRDARKSTNQLTNTPRNMPVLDRSRSCKYNMAEGEGALIAPPCRARETASVRQPLCAGFRPDGVGTSWWRGQRPAGPCWHGSCAGAHARPHGRFLPNSGRCGNMAALLSKSRKSV